MLTVMLENEFLRGAVWVLGEDGITTEGELPLVEADPVVLELNEEIAEMYDSYFELDSHDQGCWFNEAQRKAVLVTGARQVGKTTLLRERLPKGYACVTLDDYRARDLAARDPMSFFTVYGYPAAVDEVQLVPELFRQVKYARRTGRIPSARTSLPSRPGRYEGYDLALVRGVLSA